MCEAICQEEVNKAANNYFDSYPTDDYFVSYVLGAIEKGRELGASFHCDACKSYFARCKSEAVRQQVLTKYSYLLDVTNYVLGKIPS